MFNKKNILRLFLLIGILTFISIGVLSVVGSEYTLKIERFKTLVGYDDAVINLVQKDKVVNIANKDFKDGKLEITLRSIKKGKATIEVSSKDEDGTYIESIYVHNFGIITVNEYFGKARGDIIIQISVVIVLAVLLYMLVQEYRTSVKKNLYQYKNAVYLGIIIFVGFAFISQAIAIFNYGGFRRTLGSINSFSSLAIVLLPIAFIVSILVTISNIKLVIKEGLTWRNMLGVILGLFLCLLSITPEILYGFSFSGSLIDIHRTGSFLGFLFSAFETTIYFLVSYLECILLGTIILGIKAARHIPSYDKDYIIILGCKVGKDGLPPLLKGRVDKAIEFAKKEKEETGKDIVFVPSGGKGKDEPISEADAMKKYLLDQGINSKNILVENKSTNTYENIKNSYNLIKEKTKNPNIAFATTNYHVLRAGIIATSQKIFMEGIGSRTKAYYWINAFIREFVATVGNEKKKHLIVIIISILLIIAASYLITMTSGM